MSEKLLPGRVILAQSGCREPKSKPGQFYDLSTLECLVEPLHIVCLKIVPSRAFYTARKASAPQCFSTDGLSPAVNSTQRMSEKCQSCECSRWSISANSMCKDQWQVLLSQETKVPVWFSPGSDATNLLRAIQRRVQIADYIADQEGNGRRNIWDFQFDMLPVKQRKGKYSFWTIGIDGWKFISSASEREDWKYLATLYADDLPPLQNMQTAEIDQSLVQAVDGIAI